jgi:cell division cycle 14
MMLAQQTTKTIAVTVPAPDDSDFLDSESERDANESTAEQEGEDYTQGHPSASQRTYRGSPMSEMEAELAAVATPSTTQTTSTSYFGSMKRHPRPANKIMQMTSTFSFTYFSDPAPQADVLNQNLGRQAAGLFLPGESPAQHLARISKNEQLEKDAAPISKIAPHLAADTIVHWFNIDAELVYLSFFDDWGPLNVAMFYRFCLHLHHLIGMMQDKAALAAKPSGKTSDIHLILYTTNTPRPKANAALLAAMYAMVCGEMTPADAFHPLSEVSLRCSEGRQYADFDPLLARAGTLS